MKKEIVFVLAMVMMTACSKPLSTGIVLENLDTTVVAQNDFYQFACGGWMASHPLPDDYARYGTFDELALRNMEQVNGLIEELGSREHAFGSIEQKIGDLYRLAMDTSRRREEGYAAIKPSLAAIDAMSERGELSKALGESMEYGLFAMYVDADAMNSSMNILNEHQAGFALGEKEYYIDQDAHTQMIREEYKKHIAKMFALCGIEDGEKAADVVLRLETRLAQAALTNVELRDPVANYNKMSISELKEMVPQIDWDVFFGAMGIKTDSLSVGQVRHLQEVGRLLAEEPLEDIKTLLKWQGIDGAANYLSDDLYAQNFAFYGKLLSGKQEPSPLWKRAVGMVNGTLGEAVGQMYVERYFPEANKKRMLQLVKRLQASLNDRIGALTWMSDSTKQRAQEKLAAITIKIGYPDEWKDYSDLVIDPSLTYYANIERAARFEQAYSLSYLDKPVDKKKWYMTPQTVNAYYNPSSNEICFPAGILQPPFFDMSADDAFNYGAIGVVIGHEMTHGFDDQGCQFDKEGNLHNWWTADDRARFKARTQVMSDYFSSIEVAPGVRANGAFTLGENSADHGGLQVSFQALASLMRESIWQKGDERFSPAQRFFLSYANVWAGNIRPEEILQRTKSDPHSLGRWRVNGALPHIGAWYEAWNVTEESPLFLPEEKRVSIW